ncbi:hypothetical protein DV735_g1651, partial [Chaetothyriales sp. CBS 134920]
MDSNGGVPTGAEKRPETVEEKYQAGAETDTRPHRTGNAALLSEEDTWTPDEKEAGTPLSVLESKAPNAAHVSVSPTVGSDSSATEHENGKAKLSTLDSVIEAGEPQDDDAALAHLSEPEREVLKRQLDIPDVKVTYKSLFRYATTWDMVFLAIAALASIGGGAALPLMTVIFGNLSGTFQGLMLGTLTESFTSILNRYVLYFVYLAIAEFALTYISTVLFLYVGEHITSKVRQEYLRAILRQNIGFFDKLGAGEVTTRITADTNLIQDAISEKVGLTLSAVAALIAAFVIGFIKFWKLTLICLSSVVAIIFTMGAGGGLMSGWNKRSINAYAEGGSVAEEVLASIRNAVAFGTQDRLARQYDLHLQEAQKWGFKTKAMLGFMIGCLMFFLFLNYGLAFWMGSRFLVDGETTLAHILTIIFAIMIGAFSFGNIGPHMQTFTAGVAAAVKIYSTIDRVSPLDPTADVGIKPDHIDGVLELRNVRHIYPSRPEVVVMEDVSLLIPSGKTTALVGASGSGKSTIVGLVERFYDPVGGSILLDGIPIQELNLRWLRQQIALVQQEPVLFSQTIRGNILNGLIGSRFEHETDEEKTERIIRAAKMANAHDFISALPEGYETNVGERGFLLSGGQKQRIAIARAVVSDPKILLLDEATSALDTKSEGVVQHALEEAAKGRTTIVIAHRLSTIKDADNIVVMQHGKIVEQGTHDQLLQRKGAYYNLVSAQRIEQDKEDEALGKDANDSDEHLVRLQSKTSGTSGQGADAEDEKYALGRTRSTKSVSSRVLEERGQPGPADYSLLTLIKFMAGFNAKEWWIMGIGFIFTAIAGAGNPVQGVFFSKAVVALSRPLTERHKIRSDINFWGLMYIMLAFVQLISMWTQGIAFAYSSEALIHRARDRAFRSMLRQDIAFFDEDENSTGALTSFLSTETTHLASLSGSTLGTLINCATILIVAVIIALAIGWKLALVCICALPVILGSGFLRFWVLAKFTALAQKAYKESAGYACEHTNAIRTVASLTTEDEIFDDYRGQLAAQLRSGLGSNLRNSALYAFSQSSMLLAMALGFWYGGTLLKSREYSMFQFFIVFTEIIFSAQSAGTVFSFAGDMSKAKNAAAELKHLLDRQPRIDPWSDQGAPCEHVEGNIEFRDVHFRYPTRPDVPVLRGLDLTVKAGQYIALVGASGCGKSTTIALLERFYDPLAGGVYVDGKEISSLNLNEYRSHIALVSQEPTLYQGTIRENILLGLPDTDSETIKDNVSAYDDRIIQACKEANIYDFIMSLPEGFSTPVGSKAALLSGGQKQRIAIARALLRNPKILLLDEATSALDSESEKVVQAALDAAAKGRTTIAVAHRLSTIQKADVIYVFDKGVVAEKGTHRELMELNGRYRELVSLQSLEKGQ